MIRPAYPQLRLVDIPYGGHTVLVTLSQANLLKPLILSLIEDDEIIPFTPPGEGTASWHAERAASILRSDIDAGIRELEKSLSIRAATQPYCRLISALLRKGDLGAVQARIDRAIASGEPQLKIVPSLQRKLGALGLRTS